MPLTVEEIKNRRFTTVRIREGYDIAEVDEFLAEVEKSVANYTRQINSLLDAVNADPGDAPVAVTDTASASRAAARMLEVATAEAETVLSEARSDARSMITEAREEAEVVRATAARDQSRLREELERRRAEALEAFAAERDRLRSRLAALAAAEDTYRHDISERLRHHLELLERATPLPDADIPEPAVTGPEAGEHPAAHHPDSGWEREPAAPDADPAPAVDESPQEPPAPAEPVRTPEYHRPTEPAPTFGVGSYGGRVPQAIKRSTPGSGGGRQQALWSDTDHGDAPLTEGH